jgi:hypothetical protein
MMMSSKISKITVHFWGLFGANAGFWGHSEANTKSTRIIPQLRDFTLILTPNIPQLRDFTKYPAIAGSYLKYLPTNIPQMRDLNSYPAFAGSISPLLA